MQYVKKISIDVNAQDLITSIYAKQGDIDSRFLNVQLTDNGQAVTPPVGAYCILRCHKPDGYATMNGGTIEDDGTITFPLTEQTLLIPGVVKSDISVSSNGTLLSSTSFHIVVMPMPDLNAGEVVSSNEYTAMIEALASIRSATIEVGTVTKGEEASVTNVGTDTDAIFDFVLPKGDTGPRGTGITSIELTAGDHAPGTLDTYTITYDDGSTTTFQIYNGKDSNITLPVSITHGGTGATTVKSALENLYGLSKVAVNYASDTPDIDTIMDGAMIVPIAYSQSCPISDTFVYILQVFLNPPAVNTSRIQLALPYSAGVEGLAVRCNQSGVWTSWASISSTIYSTSQPTAVKGAIWLKPVE